MNPFVCTEKRRCCEWMMQRSKANLETTLTHETDAHSHTHTHYFSSPSPLLNSNAPAKVLLLDSIAGTNDER